MDVVNGWPTGVNNPLSDLDIQAHHIAAVIVITAVLFLLLVERGFHGLKIDIN